MKRMASSQHLRGLFSTSTPIQEQDDSGYVSSSYKNNFIQSSKGDVIDLSPVSEFLPLKHMHLDFPQVTLQDLQNALDRRDSGAGTVRKLQFDVFDKCDKECSTQSVDDSGIEYEKPPSHKNFIRLKAFSQQDMDKETNSLPSVVNSIKLSPSKHSNTSIQSYNCNCNNHITNLPWDHVWHVEGHMACCQVNSFSGGNEKNTCNAFTGSSTKLKEDLYKHRSIDILSELNRMNCSSILSCLLSYLSEEDLRKASYVCRNWHEIVKQDKRACLRREKYVKMKKEIAVGPNKENRYIPFVKKVRYHKTAFHSMTNIPEQPLYQINSKEKYEPFLEEKKNLLNADILLKCPKCCSPSRIIIENRYCCTRKLCQYVFCKKCFGPYLDIHECSLVGLVKIPKIVIGSKHSKRNLKRL